MSPGSAAAILPAVTQVPRGPGATAVTTRRRRHVTLRIPSMDIYVGNLPYRLSEQELRDAFAAHGTVTSAKIIKERETDRSKGYGFVTMPDRGEAEKAIAALDGQELGGRPLRVNEARPREPRR